MPSDRKFTFDIIMLIFIALSFVVSIRSCNIADRSNKISEKAQEVSEKALEITKNQFLQENRPYIIVSPIKHEETDSFFKFASNNFEVITTIKFEVKNVGKAVAKYLQVPKQALLSEEMLKKGDVLKAYIRPDKVSIGPGDKIYLLSQLIAEYEDNDSVKEHIANFESGKASVELGLKLYYLNDQNPSIMYETFVKHRIYNTEAVIVQSEYTRHDIKP